jgi:hypothetical protein
MQKLLLDRKRSTTKEQNKSLFLPLLEWRQLMAEKKLYTIAGWENYNSTPAPIFSNRKEAEKVALMGRLMRARVFVTCYKDPAESA